MKINLIKLFLILNNILLSLNFYQYSSNLKVFLRKSNNNPAINFMNLNEILNNKNKNNMLNITYLNNNKSILFNYNTYSYLDDYKYSHEYLLKNKNFFIAKYSFNIDYNNYKYLLLIKSYLINNYKYQWNIHIKYNNLFINKNETDKIILHMIKRCIYKKQNNINPILTNFFDLNNK